MKQFFPFLILLFARLVPSAQAQTSIYHPFPDSIVVWNVDFRVWNTCGTLGDEESYSYILNGDTVINSLSYHKVIVPFIQLYGCPITNMNISGFRGSVRQDISIRKVFFIPPLDSVEQVLYDFNLQIGDTLKGYLARNCSLGGNTDIISGIDSILVGNTYRKRWAISVMSFSPHAYLIEGISSSWGLLESPCLLIDGPEYTLTCFKQNDNVIYPDTTTSCNLITTISGVSSKSISLSIYPNPFHTNATIQVNPEFEKGKLKFYNSLGLLVREEDISQRKTFTLFRKDLPSGIFFLQLINDNGQIITQKLILD